MRPGIQLDYDLANPLEKCSKPVTKKSKSFQVCCPSEMQIASDLFLVKFGSIIFKFGTFGSFSNMTFENYLIL